MNFERLEKAVFNSHDKLDYGSGWQLADRSLELHEKLFPRPKRKESKDRDPMDDECPPTTAQEEIYWNLKEAGDAINEHPDKYGKYKAEYDALVADVEVFIEKFSG